MFLYLLVFLIGTLYFLFARGNYFKSNLLLGLFFIYIVLFIGLGDMIGGSDRYIYGELFDKIADETWGSRDYFKLMYFVNGNEYGYFLWEILCSFITTNRYIFIFMTIALTYTLYFFAFKKFISDYPLGCILFLGLLYYFTITYLRQTLACGIAWNAIQYIWERKPLKFFIIIIIAYSFHNSSLAFFPAYFFSYKKYSVGTILTLMFVCLLIGLTSIPTFVMSLSGGERTSEYTNQMSGFRIEYIYEVVFFLTLVFLNYKNISYDRKSITFVNMCFAFCGILLLFMRFGQGGRFGWFYMIGLIYFSTDLLKKKYLYIWMRPLLYTMSLALFLRLSFLWSFNLSPYKTFLEKGLPAGESWIPETFEYDAKYNINKFYRPAFTFIEFTN